MKKISNKKLKIEYRKVYSEYESERNFGNFCSRTLTRLLILEKILIERGYEIIINQKSEISFSGNNKQL